MNKFNFYNKEGSYSTNHSNHSARNYNNNPTQQSITPFAALQHSPSLSKQRLQNSPLHIPLAIAINKLAKKHKNNDPHNTHRTLFRSDGEKQNMVEYVYNNEIENIKNILQEFTQSLYLTVQKEIYKKFNCEMKRMMLKYRQTQNLLNKINQKLILNADIIDSEMKFKVQGQHYKKAINDLQQNIKKMSIQIQSHKQKCQNANKLSTKLEVQNKKLKQNNQKYQATLINLMKHVQSSKRSQQSQRQSFIQSLQRQRQLYRKSIRQCNKPMKSMMANYQTELSKVENSNSLSHSYIHNINKLEPSHSPVKKAKVPTHDISKRVRAETQKCHFKLKISQKE